MARSPAFLDTNIFVYGHTQGDRSEVARFLATEPYTISVQVLNEFANVALRKLRLPWPIVEPALADMAEVASAVLPLTMLTHQRGLRIAKRYKLQIYDGVLLASALEAGCDTLWSEDMHDGMVVEEQLTVRNPFLL